MAKISLDLARSSQISVVFQNFLVGYCRFSYFLGRILAVFQIINPHRDPTIFRQEPSDPIRFSDWSAAGLKNWNPTWLGRLRVGHKPDPDRPVVTLTRRHPALGYLVVRLRTSLPSGLLKVGISSNATSTFPDGVPTLR